MSVKVKLNNKSFFGGNSLLIGARVNESTLFEEGATPVNNASTGNNASTVNNAAAGNITPVNNASTVNNAAAGNTTPVNNATTGQPNITQQITKVINGGFQSLVNYINQNVKQIQGPNWPEAPQQLQGTTEEVLKSAQGYLQGVINAAKEAINNQNQGTQNAASASPADNNQTNQPAQNQPA